MHVYSKWHLLHQSTQVTGQVVNLRDEKFNCVSPVSEGETNRVVREGECRVESREEREAKRRQLIYELFHGHLVNIKRESEDW